MKTNSNLLLAQSFSYKMKKFRLYLFIYLFSSDFSSFFFGCFLWGNDLWPKAKKGPGREMKFKAS